MNIFDINWKYFFGCVYIFFPIFVCLIACRYSVRRFILKRNTKDAKKSLKTCSSLLSELENQIHYKDAVANWRAETMQKQMESIIAQNQMLQEKVVIHTKLGEEVSKQLSLALSQLNDIPNG